MIDATFMLALYAASERHSSSLIISWEHVFILDKIVQGARHALKQMAAPFDLETLYADHAQALFAFLLNFTRNETDTRDVLQELFVKLVRKPELLVGVRDERAFLLHLAHNLAIDLIRRRGSRHKHHERLAEEPMPLFAPATEPDECGVGRTAL